VLPLSEERGGEKAECDYRTEKRKRHIERERERERERRMGRIGEATERIVLNYHPLHIPDFS